ncbi:SAM-dependent methyltransferase [Marinactinospora thermotolerans]|nr:SAM-dependent methyltransferase [Marinactinospora thermotolerans]
MLPLMAAQDVRTAGSFPPEIDPTTPQVARIYDALLYGKDNFGPDRDAAAQLMESFPEIRRVALDNRAWLSRVVRHLTAEAGITQFIDVGSGLPTAENTHQVAQSIAADARVVYIDNDPIVLAHGRAILADNPNTTVITADATDPHSILEHPDLTALIDFSKPVGLLFIALMHCIPDSARPKEALQTMLSALVPGSRLAFSHLVSDDPAAAAELTDFMLSSTRGNWGRIRTVEEARAYVEGLEMVDPGFTDVRTWRNPDGATPEQSIWEIGGVAIID